MKGEGASADWSTVSKVRLFIAASVEEEREWVEDEREIDLTSHILGDNRGIDEIRPTLPHFNFFKAVSKSSLLTGALLQ